VLPTCTDAAIKRKPKRRFIAALQKGSRTRRRGMDADDRGRPGVVLVHDWLTGMRGGEKCLEVLARRWPHASLYTLLHRRGSVSAAIEQFQPTVSWLGRLPGAHR